MKIAYFPNPSASRYWRMDLPAKYLVRNGIEARVIETGMDANSLLWADIIVVQGLTDMDKMQLLYYFKEHYGKKLVVEQDDRIEVQDDNPYKKEHEAVDASEKVKTMISLADMVTTTNEYLADKLRDYNPNVVVLPNAIDLEIWDLPKKSNTSNQIRVGWAGSITHLNDLASIVEPLVKLSQEISRLKFIFVGEPRAKELFPKLNAEYMLGVPFDCWPAKLNSLQLDCAIAPLLDTDFNRCKSPIKFYEYSIARIPGVYSPTVYNFRGFDSEFGLIARTPEQWYQSIKNLITYKPIREDIARKAYAHVKTRRSLKKKIALWIKAYQSLL